jgi:uncharacterized membrane protein
MSEKSDEKVKVEVSTGAGWLSIALLVIAFYGDPDLVDALIRYLSTTK